MCVLVVLLSSSRIFFFGCYFLLALACALLFTLDKNEFLSPEEDSFPLYPMRGKHIKVFIITHNI